MRSPAAEISVSRPIRPAALSTRETLDGLATVWALARSLAYRNTAAAFSHSAACHWYTWKQKSRSFGRS